MKPQPQYKTPSRISAQRIDGYISDQYLLVTYYYEEKVSLQWYKKSMSF